MMLELVCKCHFKLKCIEWPNFFYGLQLMKVRFWTVNMRFSLHKQSVFANTKIRVSTFGIGSINNKNKVTFVKICEIAGIVWHTLNVLISVRIVSLFMVFIDFHTEQSGDCVCVCFFFKVFRSEHHSNGIIFKFQISIRCHIMARTCFMPL